MAPKPYNNNDLIWEAVRRNQDYQRYYKSMNNKKSNGWDSRLLLRWGMKRLFDYHVSIEEINKKIQQKKLRKEEHPFYNYFESKSENVQLEKFPAITYLDAKRIKNGKKSKETEKILVDWANELYLKNLERIIISIDPFEKESSVLTKIKDIKRDVVKSSKKQLESILNGDKRKRKKIRGYYRECHLYHSIIHKPKISKYIQILEKYDDIYSKVIKKAISSGDKYFCRILCGALHLPKNFDFGTIVDDNEVEEQKTKTKGYDEAVEKKDGKLMTEVSFRAKQAVEKYYERSYNKAAEMIRSAPERIYFHS